MLDCGLQLHPVDVTGCDSSLDNFGDLGTCFFEFRLIAIVGACLVQHLPDLRSVGAELFNIYRDPTRAGPRQNQVEDLLAGNAVSVEKAILWRREVDNHPRYR